MKEERDTKSTVMRETDRVKYAQKAKGFVVLVVVGSLVGLGDEEGLWVLGETVRSGESCVSSSSVMIAMDEERFKL